MPTSRVSPVFNWPIYDHNVSPAIPLNGGKVFTYIAGTTVKIPTYKDEAGTIAHTNPIILGVDGLPPDLIRLQDGVKYKLVLAPATDTDPPTSPIRTYDNIEGVNDVPPVGSAITGEWVADTTGPLVVDTDTLTMVGDRRAAYHIGRRIQLIGTFGTVYATIKESTFSGGNTTISLEDATGVLSGGITTTSYGINSSVNPSDPLQRIAPEWRLDYVDLTTIRLQPYNGNRIMIKTQGEWIPRVLPSAGISSGLTNVMIDGVPGQTLAVNILYYVYVFDNAGVITFDFRSTLSSHGPDVLSGVEIMISNPTRALVGMVLPSSIFSLGLVASWANRKRHAPIKTHVQTNFVNTSYAPLSGFVLGGSCLQWANEPVIASFCGNISSNTINATSYATLTIGGPVKEEYASACSHYVANAIVPVSYTATFISANDTQVILDTAFKTTAGTATLIGASANNIPSFTLDSQI